MGTYLIYLVMLMQQGQSGTVACGDMCTTTSGAITMASAITTPMAVIHMSGDVVLEINSNGKHLNVMADGTVTGDLPHDAAADQFWKAVALIAPTNKCESRASSSTQGSGK